MARYYKNKNTRYSSEYNFATDNIRIADTENMYIDYDNGGEWLESFPGYRQMYKFTERINGIFKPDNGQKDFIIHTGTNLYKCYYPDNFKNAFFTVWLCAMNDHKSFCYRMGDNICIFDGTDIVMIDKDYKTKKLSSYSDIAYLPTTYIDGKEAEQVNILSDKFREEYHGFSIDDFAYESEGLIFGILSETDKTCSVTGIGADLRGRVDIPNRKRINGCYYKVVEVGDGAFSGNTKITAVILGNGIKRVGKRAFMDCTALTLAVMPDGIETIDESAFAGCGKLSEVYIGVTCKSIYYNAFSDCKMISNVYFSDTPEHVEKCDGVGNLFVYPIEYSTKYTDYAVGIPIFTPAKSIIEVKVGEAGLTYTAEAERGIVKLNYTSPGEIEGKDISVTGIIDRTVCHNSERGVSFPKLISQEQTGKDVISSCKGGDIYDGRVMLFGAEEYPHTVFASSFTKDGAAHPLYFGELDYFAVGNPDLAISDLKKAGGRLAIAKREEKGGSIFLHSPKGAEKAVFGRSYPVVVCIENTGVKSELFAFDNSTFFIGNEGVCKMKYSSSAATVSCISRGCPKSMSDYLSEDASFSTLGGYLAIFSNSNLYLGDKRLGFKALGENQYRWYPILNVGAYKDDYTLYYYAERGGPGIYIHSDIGKVAKETIYSLVGEDGVTYYYVQIGMKKYAVINGDEKVGGSLVPATVAQAGENTIIFGTAEGHILSLNTDMKGVPPKYIYQDRNYNGSEYAMTYKNRIHPHFYTHFGHRVRYSVTTPPDDGGIGYARKDSIKKSLAVRLAPRSGGTISFRVDTESKMGEELPSYTMGELNMRELDFGKISFCGGEPVIVGVDENKRNWVEKQITVYTEDLKAPFAISGLTHTFKIKGDVRN